MADDREERIRKLAYEMWQRDGSPEGQHDLHWHEAAREVDAQMQDESRAKGAASPAPHQGDEGGAGLGGAEVSGAGKPKAPRARKSAATGADGAAKPARKAAAKSTKAPARSSTPRKPRAKKDAPPGDAG
ncbi:hypothetical protein FHS00_001501 [Limimaricola variabilis]|uniref:DUF2934 domain-containing protein n=1 Tax=Limimaricola variabilis TaxID=1492771 RepID=A0ABR6HMY4_9RHOB|nr:DUF2934 domain-containing protein [Limimaricola variabilis]MBB3711925.1 hypothetical protein [Limimaricola variabilis]